MSFNFKKKGNQNKDYNDRYIYSYKEKTSGGENASTKKSNKKNWLCSLGIIIFLIIGLVGGAMLYVYNKLDSINYKPVEDTAELTSDSDNSGLLQEKMVLNVALFGIDRRSEAETKSRSDSSLILSIDSRRKKIKLTSLMRDIWTDIPGYKPNRLNVAIAHGGEKLAIQTIQKTFGIKIDRYATVDFESFKEIVDIIGGIDLSLSAKEAKYINGDLIYYKSASPLLPIEDGTYHLDGDKTLSYARARKVQTPEGLHDDFARTFRQRRVLSTIMNKMKKCSLPQVLEVIEKAGPYINANFKKSEIMSLGKNSLEYLDYTFEDFRLPTNDNTKEANIQGMSVIVIPDMKKARYDLAKFIYEDSIQ
ncbi:MAG: Polyisoprenyl-teichoic acid--peptidoglycan teichoic acid transferase TagU [Eubacteriales bacterium SKADARSKE-1]|nr:Polyisoprenyl-teichoic acid--peptidoglycan teichoic acid transferase TagU [Eubacteriales bacterium SKADARSKE-1]